MSIKIPVSADFDPSAIEAQLQQFREKLNALGQQISAANKVQFEPVSKTSLDDLRKMTAQFEALKRVSGDLNRRVNATGQKGAGFFDLDWAKMYPDQHSRARQMSKSFQYVTGLGFHTPPSPQQPNAPLPTRPGGGGGGGGGGGFAPAVGGVAQAGLRAMGPAGGVAAGALGTGMGAGVGAGLAGLVGGIVALAVGKMVSAVKEKIGEAEDNEVAYDTLKRSIGDVSVSFNALKIAVKNTAEANNITYKEAIKLSSEFSKASNLSSEQYKEALARGGSLDLGIGMSRSFGLDPSSGVGALGSVRGVGAARDEMQTRRFALLIGETIGKSGAFAKADEVMGAISDYTVSQTRANLSSANSSGFAGMFAGLVGSGIPGLDPAGAGSLLGRINASLSAGGAHGEASQYATSVVGRSMGLDPIQTQMMREGGAFSTSSKTFGEDSVYARFMGETGPTGDQTQLSAQLEYLRSRYGHNKGLLAQATSNHLGINMAQSMAMHLVSPEQMGEMSGYADITKMSGESIGGLSKALFGTSQDRADIANNLYRRTGDGALSREEIELLDKAFSMDGSSGAEAQKMALSELLSTRGQDDTQGKDIRDSKNALENLKVSMAERLIPLTQTMRDGILSIAGVGKDGATTESILSDMAKAESQSMIDSLNNKHKTSVLDLGDKRKQLLSEYNALPQGDPRRTAISRERDAILEEIKQKQEFHAAALGKERRALTEKIEQIQANIEEQAKFDQEEADVRRARIDLMKKQLDAEKESADKGERFSARGPDGSGLGGTGGGAAAAGAALGGGGRAEAIQYFMDSGWTKEQAAGIVANLVSESQLDPSAVGDGGQAYGVAQWHPDRQAEFKKWSGKSIRDSSLAEQYAFVNYEMNEGNERSAGNRLRNTSTARDAGDVVSRYYERPKNKVAEANKRGALAEHLHGTPLPQGGGGIAGTQQQVAFEPINVNVSHTNELGEQVRPAESMTTKVANNWQVAR